MEKQGQRGAAAVEFAIVLPLLALILFGIIEFGLLFYNKQVLTNASREGARAGISRVTESRIEEIVVTYCSSRLIRFGTGVDPYATISGAMGSYGQDLTVTVNYNYTFLVPDLFGFGPSMLLTAETVMRMESLPAP